MFTGKAFHVLQCVPAVSHSYLKCRRYQAFKSSLAFVLRENIVYRAFNVKDLQA